MTGKLLGASLSGLIGDFLGWPRRARRAWLTGGLGSVAVAIGFRGGVLKRRRQKSIFRCSGTAYRTILPIRREGRYAAVFCRRLLRAWRVFPMSRSFLFDSASSQPFHQRPRDRRLSGRRTVSTIERVALSAAARRQRYDDSGAMLMGCNSPSFAFGPPGSFQAGNFILMGWGFYMIHGSAGRCFASELSVEARPARCRCTRFSSSWPDHRNRSRTGLHLNVGKDTDLAGKRRSSIVVLGFVCARL